MLKSLPNFWKSLPASVRYLLLVGSVGRNHLTGIAAEVARVCTEERRSEKMQLFVSLCSQLILAAWEEDPLHPETAEQLWRWHARFPFLDEHTAAVVRAVCDEVLLAKNSSKGKCLPKTDESISEGAENKYTYTLLDYRRAYWHAMCEGNYDEARSRLEETQWPHPVERLRQRYLASVYWTKGEYHLWEKALTCGGAVLSDADRCLQLGNLAFAQGHRPKALALWRQCLTFRPWLTQLILKSYDVANELDHLRRPLEGQVVICLYTYNKASELQDSLSSLAQSALGAAKILLLVNGCTDNTRHVARAWQERLGEERLRMIDLPINIGAPAARNWLMHDPEVREADWIAYLDDDALVPAEWLHLLGGAVKRYPHAGTWGCRVVDARVPSTIQAVDYHALPPTCADGAQNAAPFLLSMLHYETIDQGQYSYLRPCVHVTGCCHLFSTKTLLESGDFDLRFSPSQFDDLEHDFRLAFSGKPAVYQGHLAVRHMNRTAKRTRVHVGERGSAGANLYKLHQKYSRQEYLNLIQWNMSLIEKDFFQKLKESTFYGGC